MTIGDHSDKYAGYPICDWQPGSRLENPAGCLIRIGITYDEADEGVTWTDKFAEFLDSPAAAVVPGIVVGAWDEVGVEVGSAGIVEALVAARDSLPCLHVIFFGDITYEEAEISWIEQSDMAPLFGAYPQLTHFCVRGGNQLSFGLLRHENLRQLIVQSGGLGRDVVRQIGRAQLPKLEWLELWLGDSNYGGDCEVDDLQPILAGVQFPLLKQLGLKNAEKQDEIAVAVASAPVLQQLETLDLSMGTLTELGAQALLNSGGVKKLKHLNLAENYLSAPLLTRFNALGISVNLAEQKTGDEGDRYVSVAE